MYNTCCTTSMESDDWETSEARESDMVSNLLESENFNDAVKIVPQATIHGRLVNVISEAVDVRKKSSVSITLEKPTAIETSRSEEGRESEMSQMQVKETDTATDMKAFNEHTSLIQSANNCTVDKFASWSGFANTNLTLLNTWGPTLPGNFPKHDKFNKNELEYARYRNLPDSHAQPAHWWTVSSTTSIT